MILLLPVYAAQRLFIFINNRYNKQYNESLGNLNNDDVFHDDEKKKSTLEIISFD